MKPQPCLQDMPLHVKRTIADHLESYLDKLSFQKLNKHFQQVIEIPVQGATLSLSLDKEDISVVFEWSKKVFEKRYSQEGSVCRRRINTPNRPAKKEVDKKTDKKVDAISFGYPFIFSPNLYAGIYGPKQYEEKLFANKDAVDMAITDFEMFLSIPRATDLKLKLKLPGDYDCLKPKRQELLQKIIETLKNPVRKPHVKSLDLNYAGTEDVILQILPCLDPLFLESLHLHCDYRNTLDFNKIKHLDQIKCLRELSSSKIHNFSFDALPNCRNGYIRPVVELKDLRKFVKHFRTTPNFNLGSIGIETNYNDKKITKALCKFDEFTRTDDDYTTFLYKTPTKNFLNISVWEGRITFEGYLIKGEDPSIYGVEEDDKDEDDFYEVEDDEDYGESDDSFGGGD